MFEKINAETGEYGDGGEYFVQTGFGWTNGAVLDILTKFDLVYDEANGGAVQNKASYFLIHVLLSFITLRV